MSERLHAFVADELWLVLSVVTVGLVALAGQFGLSGVSGTVAVVGFLILVPLFLFWGEEIADWLVGAPDAEEPRLDAMEELKTRYARGEIDEEEFERRLDTMLDADDRRERELER